METIPVIGVSVWTVAKIVVLFALGLYLIFAFVVVRQAKIMTETLEIGLEEVIRMIAFFHLLFAVGTFFLALVIL